jgi:hypothetical protein
MPLYAQTNKNKMRHMKTVEIHFFTAVIRYSMQDHICKDGKDEEL